MEISETKIDDSACHTDNKLSFLPQKRGKKYILNMIFYILNSFFPFKFHTVKPRKEEPRKLRTNRLFLKILYPLVKNQCQGVLE